MVEKVYEISMLYDFYGQMLTDKQRDIIDLYYNNDFSLGEISESAGISRQGVHDLLRRSEKILYHYENQLRLVEKFINQRDKIKIAYALLDSMGTGDVIDKIKSILNEILETNI